MVEIVEFDTVRENIISSIKKKMLIPILGSGFSRGCACLNGTVPSGTDFKRYMAEQIVAAQKMDASDETALYNSSFSEVASFYHQVVSTSDQRAYLKDNFTKVILDEDKKRLLAHNWPYIYTLNIDDAIEQNSQYTQVLYSNRDIEESVFDEKLCVVKLHGDISDMLSYKDSACEVFDREQYILSLQKNKSLLKHLANDFTFNTPMYIGCSLSDEIDLLAASMNIEKGDTKNIRYYCTTSMPTALERLRLEKFKIDVCIVFDSYNDIYEKISRAAEEAAKIAFDEIENYKSYSFSNTDSSFATNKSYLFHGKMLVNRDHSISLPYFFISRNITDTIINNITRKKYVQLLLGSGCSGKTYIGIDVIRRIRDRDVYAFSSKDSVSEQALDSLLNRRDCLIIADSNSLQIQQIEKILRSYPCISQNNVFFLIIERKNNRDLLGVLKLLELKGILRENSIPQIEVNSNFNKAETTEINEKLAVTTLGIFSERRSIVDNIIYASNKLIEKNRYSTIVPKHSNPREIAALIALAIKQKIFSSEAMGLALSDIFVLQERFTAPLIESEATWAFERSRSNNSPIKYVVNAEYWLRCQLNCLSQTKEGRSLIVKAYEYIVTMLIGQYGKPDLGHGDNNASYKPYILFDEINQIFYSNGLTLIREIYISLSGLLSTDPNYMHQRAKCYIRSAANSSDYTEKILFLENAYRDAVVSNEVFVKRFETFHNEKINISVAHTEYTKAIIACHMAKTKEYADTKLNSDAIESLCIALRSPYNSYDFAKKDRYNYGNVIKDIIQSLSANQGLVYNISRKYLAELLKLLIDS